MWLESFTKKLFLLSLKPIEFSAFSMQKNRMQTNQQSEPTNQSPTLSTTQDFWPDFEVEECFTETPTNTGFQTEDSNLCLTFTFVKEGFGRYVIPSKKGHKCYSWQRSVYEPVEYLTDYLCALGFVWIDTLGNTVMFEYANPELFMEEVERYAERADFNIKTRVEQFSGDPYPIIPRRKSIGQQPQSLICAF